MAKNFDIKRMIVLNKPPSKFQSPSEFIKRAYGKKERADKGQARVNNANDPMAYLRKPFNAQQRANLTPAELTYVRQYEKERKNRSLANRRAKQEAMGFGSLNPIGSGSKPPEKTFYDIVKEGYNAEPSPNIDGMDLILNTPTVKAYLDRNAKTIMLVSRGTIGESGDIKADASIAVNRLKYSDRYNVDKGIIGNLANEYPPSTYDYFMTGHSLGGATTAQLKRDFPFIKDAVVYNPASQPYDFISQQSDQIKRIYTEDDPLYALGGTFMTNKQVIPTKRDTIKMRTGTIADYGIKANNYLQGHALDNFNTLYGGYFHRKGDGTGSLHNGSNQRFFNVDPKMNVGMKTMGGCGKCKNTCGGRI